MIGDIHGIDVVYRAEGKRAEYDFVVSPGADAARGGEGGNADIGNWDAGEGSEA